jgi:hypothetical protein
MTKTPHWTYNSSRYEGKKHCLVYRDDHLGVELQVFTPSGTSFFAGREKKAYLIDGVEKKFRSEQAMLRMLDRIAEREVQGRHSLIIHMSHSLNTYDDRPRSMLRRLTSRFRLRQRRHA